MLTVVTDLLNPETLIGYGGFWLVLLIVFAETGLLIGFFLPGDALLFAAGLLTASGTLEYGIGALLLGLNLAAITGNMLGYAFGKKVGKSLFKRDDSFLFKKKYIHLSEAFFDKYGGLALIIGRFLPIVRTFAPILAGVAKYNYRIFLLYNIFGSILWTVFMAGSGYYLVKIYPPLKDYIGLVTFLLIVLTMGTVIGTYLKEKKKANAPR